PSLAGLHQLRHVPRLRGPRPALQGDRAGGAGSVRARAALELPAARRTLASTRLWRRGDRALILAVGALAAFGLVMVFSASEVQGWLWFHNPAYYFEHQLIWLALGVILLVAAANIDYHRLRVLAWPLGVVTVVLMVLVLLPHVGVEVNGA